MAPTLAELMGWEHHPATLSSGAFWTRPNKTYAGMQEPLIDCDDMIAWLKEHDSYVWIDVAPNSEYVRIAWAPIGDGRAESERLGSAKSLRSALELAVRSVAEVAS